MGRNFVQGTFEIKNWDKYLGTKKPRYLSSYEFEVFKWCDKSPRVLSWGSETVVVPYYNPVKQRQARYLVDVYIEYQMRDGTVRKLLCEIKPESQTKKPRRGRKRKDVFEAEMLTWITNEAKWKEATDYANKRGWEFTLLTEKSIFRA